MLKTLTTIALIALASITCPSPVQAHSINDAQNKIKAAWESKIAQHRQSDPEIASIEEKIMMAQLRCDGSSNKLMPAYIEMLAQRNPKAASILRLTERQFEQSAQMRKQFSDPFIQGNSEKAKQLLKQYLETQNNNMIGASLPPQ